MITKKECIAKIEKLIIQHRENYKMTDDEYYEGQIAGLVTALHIIKLIKEG